MFLPKSTLSLLPFLSLTTATLPPNLPNLNLIWSETWQGAAGDPIDTSRWNIALALNTNNDIQTYTSSRQNLQISGGGTVQLVPRRSPSGHWTSARIESKESFAPAPGKKTRIQGELRFGDNPGDRRQGMWPAFWMLGDSIRRGTGWPLCGELDIMEIVNGEGRAYGTAHCGVFPGGECNEPQGKGMVTELGDYGWHVWGLEWDRTNPGGDWTGESITWFRDGVQFHRLDGAGVGDMGIWSTLAHSPMYVLLNIAIGGNWPGNPNDATLDGYGSMMEAAYVAVYES